MKNERALNNLKVEEEESINIAEMVQNYLQYWKWFILSVMLTLTVAVGYIRYTTPIYKATTTILVKDDRKGGLQSELSAFSDLGAMGGVKSNVDNEIEIIKSRTIVEKAVRALDFNISYFSDGRVRNIERYQNMPIKISFIERKPEFYNLSNSFQINSKSKNEFELLNSAEKSIGVFKYGEVVDLGYTKIIVIYEDGIMSQYKLTVLVDDIRSVVQRYKSSMSIATVGRNTSVVELSITNPLREKAEKFSDEIVRQYNQDAIEDKNFISKSTD